MASTSCDVWRDALTSFYAGKCAAHGAPPECAAPRLAAKRDLLFKWRYGPEGLLESSVVRGAKLRDLEASISIDQRTLAAKYGDRPASEVVWWKAPRCLWNAQGFPGGNFDHTYLERIDLHGAGYTPQPLLGGTGAGLDAAVGPAVVSRVPVWLDRVGHPGLMAVLLFLFVLVVFAALMLRARRAQSQKRGRSRPRVAFGRSG